MTGLIYAAAPLAAACLVARREPAHRPVALALGASALYSVAALPAVASRLDGRALLGLFALVAVASGRAYTRAFGWRWTEGRIVLAGAAALMAFVVARPFVKIWTIATWGPFVASSVVGALAVWAWWVAKFQNERKIAAYFGRRFDEDGAPISVHDLRLPEPATITQRCALILLASDVCMLAFVRWPGVQAWQGRAAAIAVTVVQIVWLIKERRSSCSDS